MRRTNLIVKERRLMDLYSSNAYVNVNKLLLIKFGPVIALFFSQLVDKYKYWENRKMLEEGEWFFIKMEERLLVLQTW